MAMVIFLLFLAFLEAVWADSSLAADSPLTAKDPSFLVRLVP